MLSVISGDRARCDQLTSVGARPAHRAGHFLRASDPIPDLSTTRLVNQLRLCLRNDSHSEDMSKAANVPGSPTCADL